MLESICGWEKLDNRRGFHFDRQRLILGDVPPDGLDREFYLFRYLRGS